MSGGALSSVMSIAGAGLLPTPPADVGASFVANAALLTAISSYQDLGILQEFGNVITIAIDEEDAGNISSATLIGLETIGNVGFPALVDSVTAGNALANLVVNTLTANVTTVSAVIEFDAVQVMGNGDLSKFCQAFMTAQGYASQANAVLNSVKNSDILAQTFDPATGGMDSLTTGGLNQVSNDLPALSRDFAALGQLIDTSNLADLGLPGELLAQIGRVTGGEVAAVTDFLQAVGIDDTAIDNLAQGRNTLTSAQERTAYSALLAVSGDTLQQILLILNVTTPGIVNMAQLLDPKHILPNSYGNLVCPTAAGLEPVYLADGSINTNLLPVLENAAVSAYAGPNNVNSLDTMRLIIPPDQAVANKALARSLGQVKNIATSTLPSLSAAAAAVETNTDLGGITNLTTPIPSDVQTAYQSQLGQGSGPNGTILLTDIIGVATGKDITDNLDIVTEVIGNLVTDGATANLSGIYTAMLEVMAGDYGPPSGPVDIPSGPGTGIWATWDAALQELTTEANTEIDAIVSANQEPCDEANAAWDSIIATLLTQVDNQVQGEIKFDELQANAKSATMSFTTNLHQYGTDVEPGGANEFLVAVANVAGLGGQSVIASLREGRNIQNLQDAGIQLDTQLSDRP